MTGNRQSDDRLDRRTAHLCIDMQRMFKDDTEWRTPWMDRVLPVVERIARHRPEATVFTRFVPPHAPEEAEGAWRSYFGRWHQFTLNEIDPELIELVAPLRDLVPPAVVFDKPVYSPFFDGRLARFLKERGIETLVITGAETDVCVLAAVFGAMDQGFRVILAKDAICSGADETHDALMKVYADRFGQQVELSGSDAILERWTG
ncbi:cysteine hydrolase family protein [Jiella sp. M17.18]|uniref:cysteine hydrolase family protein n=1 Tax=Jiella sp. M17.18 TaxID=3234247 RepID=UPI0034DE856C